METKTRSQRSKKPLQPKVKAPRAPKAPRGKFNWWQLVALTLIGLIVGSGIWFAVKVATPYETPASKVTPLKATDPALTVSLTKRQVNKIVSYYLNDFQKGSPVKYSLTVADQAVLAGTFKFFGQKIKFSLLFDPLVQANGNVELKARSLNVGSLPVPISYVMGYAGRAFKLPKWVSLNSKKETIVLELNKFSMENGMQIRATKLDLPNDELDLAVYLPTK
ncbi:YpmS family protein [Lacticaseibacillus parakribbianus]|uniref:YpmS family protein n=1 Tax=Lacticaseibacillus parakribbianus TaxID=2970927 RepID=UPI0021CB2433|nr:YpmS family protein [Lacticaseibacillus parakribbianus]